MTCNLSFTSIAKPNDDNDGGKKCFLKSKFPLFQISSLRLRAQVSYIKDHLNFLKKVKSVVSCSVFSSSPKLVN